MIPFLATHSRLWLFMLAIIMMNLSMALFRSPVIALMPDLTPSRFRSKANGIINFMGGLGALLIYFGGKPLYDMQISLPFLAGGLLLLIASLLIILLIDERKANEIIPSYSQNPQPTEPANAQDKTQKGFKATFLFSFRELGHNLTDVIKGEKSLLRLLLAIFFWSMSFNSIETWFTSYAKYYLGVSESTGTLFLGFFAMSFMVFSIPAGFISVNFGRNNTIRLGIFVFVIALIFLILNKSNLLLVFLLVASGLGWAFININALPMVVDMAAHGKIGAFTGLYYFSSQTASIVAPPLSGFLIDIFGYPVILVFSLSVLLISLFLMMGVKKGEVFIHANEA
jgi:MFS family permease